jgi:hypothetical protein
MVGGSFEGVKARIVVTAVCGLLLAGWSYVEWKQGIPADKFHAVIDSWVFKVGIVAAVVLVGFLMGLRLPRSRPFSSSLFSR